MTIISVSPIQYGLFLKHYGMGGHYGPLCNFAVSSDRRTKFGSIGYFDMLSSKMALIFKFRASMTSIKRHNRKYGRFCNFVVYQGRRAKFGRLGYFDVYFS